MPRVRRPLLALIVLVLAVAIGYGVDALRGGDSVAPHPSPHSTPSVSVSR